MLFLEKEKKKKKKKKEKPEYLIKKYFFLILRYFFSGEFILQNFFKNQKKRVKGNEKSNLL